MMLERRRRHEEKHKSGRAGWLRAVVLGSDDAIVSTASLMIGVTTASATKQDTLVAGIAGLVAGAMSMAVGEYVSVSSTRDAEQADIEREKCELASDPGAELEELASKYVARGVEESLAMEVAQQLTKHDTLGAHMRDELGIHQEALSRPLQAAWTSALSFATFGAVPIVAFLFAPSASRIARVAQASLLGLAVLGGLGGYLGGATILRGALRVSLGGAIAMLVTAAIGHFVGAVIR